MEVLRERSATTRFPPGPFHEGETCRSYTRIHQGKRSIPSQYGEQMGPREEIFLWAGYVAAACSRYKPKQHLALLGLSKRVCLSGRNSSAAGVLYFHQNHVRLGV